MDQNRHGRGGVIRRKEQSECEMQASQVVFIDETRSSNPITIECIINVRGVLSLRMLQYRILLSESSIVANCKSDRALVNYRVGRIILLRVIRIKIIISSRIVRQGNSTIVGLLPCRIIRNKTCSHVHVRRLSMRSGPKNDK